MRGKPHSLPAFLTNLVPLIFLTSTLFAQNVVIDALSARKDPGFLTVKIPVTMAVPTGLFPVSVQFDLDYTVGDLRLDGLIDGPAAVAALKAARAITLSPGKMQIIVEGRSSDPIGGGTLLFLEFYQLALTPKVSPISISAPLVLDATGRKISSTANGARAILNDGIQLPSCPAMVPVECRGSQLVVPEEMTPNHEILFAQIASGVQSAEFGEYETKILLTNMMDSDGDVLLEFFGQDGRPLNTVIEGDLDNTFLIRIPRRATKVVETYYLGPATIGWLRVKSLVSIGGSVIYSFLDPARQVVSEAGILGSVYRKSFEFTVDTRANTNVGLAVANPEVNSTTLDCTLYSQSGTIIAQRSISIAGMGQIAKVISQIFPGIDLSNFVGKATVSVVGQGYVLATTLRFSNDLRLFTSIPVI